MLATNAWRELENIVIRSRGRLRGSLLRVRTKVFGREVPWTAIGAWGRIERLENTSDYTESAYSGFTQVWIFARLKFSLARTLHLNINCTLPSNEQCSKLPAEKRIKKNATAQRLQSHPHFAFRESICGFYENFLAALWHDGAKSDKAAEGSSVDENTLLSSQYIIVKQTRRWEENSHFTCTELMIWDVTEAKRYKVFRTTSRGRDKRWDMCVFYLNSLKARI